MRQKIRIAVAGAGQIGRRHVEAIAETADTALAAIVDPAPGASDYAAGLGVPHFSALGDLIARGIADAVIIATPNQLHAQNSLGCIAAGLPILIEKPIATDSEAAAAIISAADANGTPVLVGHHRRHNHPVASWSGRAPLLNHLRPRAYCGYPVSSHALTNSASCWPATHDCCSSGSWKNCSAAR